MMREYFKNRENKIIWLVFAVTMIIGVSPLISRYCINGHDISYHLLRIESLKEGIQAGKPFLKVNVLFFGGAGYASSMFYPDLLLYIPAFLRVFGVGINASYHIFVAICICLCYLGTYFCTSRICGNRSAGMIGAVLITLCQYHLDDIYVRSAVGEYTAFIFIPFVIYGIYNFIYEGADKAWVLGIGLGGVLLCHVLSFMMCLLFMAVAFIVGFRDIAEKKDTIKRLLITMVCTAAITCSYWLPMLEQFAEGSFYVSEQWIEPKQEAIQIAGIFSDRFPAMGALLFAFMIPRIFISKKDDKSVKYADMLFVLGIIFSFLASDIFPWDRAGKYLSFVQFPWRFFIMASCMLALADAVILYAGIRKLNNEKFETALLAVIVAAMAAGGLHTVSTDSQGYYDYSDDYFSYKPYTTQVIGGEWLPVSVKDPGLIVELSEYMTGDEGSDIGFIREGDHIRAGVNEAYDHIDVPFIFYKGYAAFIEENGSRYELSVTGEGRDGFVRVYTGGHTGELTVSYKGTFIQKIALIITLISTIGIAVCFFVKAKRTKNSL